MPTISVFAREAVIAREMTQLEDNEMNMVAVRRRRAQVRTSSPTCPTSALRDGDTNFEMTTILPNPAPLSNVPLSGEDGAQRRHRPLQRVVGRERRSIDARRSGAAVLARQSSPSS
jgi:hypothetical protein